MLDHLDDQTVAVAGSLMTSERLGRYHAVTGSVRGALDLHAHAMQLAGSLLAAIGVVEIALRNATCEKLTTLFATPHWLQAPPASITTWRDAEERRIGKAIRDAQRSDYAALAHQDKMALDAMAFPNGVPANIRHDVRAKRRQQTISFPDGQVIAQLTFGFWKGLYSKDYEATLWDRGLKTIFPQRRMKRPSVATLLEMIYQTRNRIAHHESVAGPRVAQVKASLDFISQNMLSRETEPSSPLAQLLRPHLVLVDQHAAAFEACLKRYKTPPMDP